MVKFKMKIESFASKLSNLATFVRISEENLTFYKTIEPLS